MSTPLQVLTSINLTSGHHPLIGATGQTSDVDAGIRHRRFTRQQGAGRSISPSWTASSTHQETSGWSTMSFIRRMGSVAVCTDMTGECYSHVACLFLCDCFWKARSNNASWAESRDRERAVVVFKQVGLVNNWEATNFLLSVHGGYYKSPWNRILNTLT